MRSCICLRKLYGADKFSMIKENKVRHKTNDGVFKVFELIIKRGQSMVERLSIANFQIATGTFNATHCIPV